jgi:hypothetical protein
MQTFLPYTDFKKSAQCLDYKRLGKQRVEAYQILLILCGLQKSKAWTNHPIIKMWKGYEWNLFDYLSEICLEWKKRGYKDTIYQKMDLLPLPTIHWDNLKRKPKWLGNKKFHASHRSNLLRKDKKYYSQFGWKEPDNLHYIWIKK